MLENDALRVTVNPQVGGTITRVEHKQRGLNVMGTVPWDPVDAPMEPAEAKDEPAWLTRYTGGWPLLFPNAGDACMFEGVEHGFHGEASITPWQAQASRAAIRLTRRFVSVPVQMRRDIALDGDLITVRETAEAVGQHPVEVMWGHHPTFGSDLLDGDFELQSGAVLSRWTTSMIRRGIPCCPVRPASGRWRRGRWGPSICAARSMARRVTPRWHSCMTSTALGFPSAAWTMRWPWRCPGTKRCSRARGCGSTSAP